MKHGKYGVFCHLKNSLYQQISQQTLDVGAILYVAFHTSSFLLGHKISLSLSTLPCGHTHELQHTMTPNWTTNMAEQDTLLYKYTSCIQKTDGGILYKQILINAKLQIGNRGKKKS
jgi:hypothetical protein